MTLTLRNTLPLDALARYADLRRQQGWAEDAIRARVDQPISEQLQASVEQNALKERKRWEKRRKRAA